MDRFIADNTRLFRLPISLLRRRRYGLWWRVWSLRKFLWHCLLACLQCVQMLSKIGQKVATAVTLFKIDRKTAKYLGYFWKKICHQDLSKLTQSGHTARLAFPSLFSFVCSFPGCSVFLTSPLRGAIWRLLYLPAVGCRQERVFEAEWHSYNLAYLHLLHLNSSKLKLFTWVFYFDICLPFTTLDTYNMHFCACKWWISCNLRVLFTFCNNVITVVVWAT